MRIYIAGKIGALPPDVWLENFAKARAEVLALDPQNIPVCPTQLRHSHGRTWLDYMREDITAMLTCEAVYAQNNYKSSPGATIEVDLALALGLEVIFQQ